MKRTPNAKGTIEIDYNAGTISIQLNNGSFCESHYPQGVMHFLADEIAFVNFSNKKKEEPKNPATPETLNELMEILYPKGWEKVND